MDTEYKIIVVEDDRTTRLLLQTSLGSHYGVECFDTAEALLGSENKAQACLFLLDVGLPSMDGLQLCRALKDDGALSQVPVMFLSAHDTPEEILAGYEAGAQDYIVKPFDVATLHYKVENLQRINAERCALAEQAQSSDDLTMQILANLDEYAVLVKFLRNLNDCTTPADLVAAAQQTLEAFNLEGAVQIRLRGVEKTYSGYGENWPLEVAVMRQLRTQGSVFEHKHLAAFNFEHITVLVTNMPRNDMELCGRIRDHLAIAVESANAKLSALLTVNDNSWMRGEISAILHNIGQALDSLSVKYQNARAEEALATNEFIGEITTTFAEVGMSELQEDQLLESVRVRLKEFANLYDIAPQTQHTLQALTTRMKEILQQGA